MASTKTNCLMEDIAPKTSPSPLDNIIMVAEKLAHLTCSPCFIGTWDGSTANIVYHPQKGDLPNNHMPAIQQACTTQKPVVDKDMGITCIPITNKPPDFFVEMEDAAELRKGDTYSSTSGFVYLTTTQNFDGLLAQIESINNFLASCLQFYSEFKMASTDKLTGALTRKFMDVALEECLKRAKANNKGFSIIMLDLDYFKHINDTYGHLVGDDVLRDVAKIIQNNLGIAHTLGRYGGEEFIIALEGAGTEKAAETADFLRTTLSNSKILGDKRDVTASLGIAAFPGHGNTVKELVDKADKALYAAKAAGRNKTIIWQEGLEGAKSKKRDRELFTGDIAKDALKMRSLYKIIGITTQNLTVQQRLAMCLDEARNILDASDLEFFAVEHNGEEGGVFNINSLARLGRNQDRFNDEIIQEVIKTQHTACLVDWDNKKIRTNDGIYDWQSIIAAPAMENGRVKGVLYAAIPIKVKEFTDYESGFASGVAAIISTMMG